MEWESKGVPATLWIWERLKLSLTMLVPWQTTRDVACSYMLFIHCVKQQRANELEYKTSDTARCSSAAQHREATLRMGPCILGVFILHWIIGTTASSS